MPGRPETNGKAERAVRKVLNACRTILLFAGLSPKFWPFAARYFAFVHNITLNDMGSQRGKEEKEVTISSKVQKYLLVH